MLQRQSLLIFASDPFLGVAVSCQNHGTRCTPAGS